MSLQAGNPPEIPQGTSLEVGKLESPFLQRCSIGDPEVTSL